jgi:hypothetical protein
LLGVAVALAGPAVFGVLAAPGGIELNAKEMALAFGLGALIFWAVVSYFSGAGALGAFAAFGTLIYCWLWIPNRTTNFLNDVPGVTNGMIEGSKQYTQNGVVPILGVISLVYAIQLIVRAVQRRRRERADAERLQQEQEAAQAQQEADVAAVYPVAAGTYQAAPSYESHSRYDDLFDEPAPVQPRNQADEQTRQFPVGDAEEFEHTRTFAAPDAESNESGEETVAAPAAAVADQHDEPPQSTEEPTVQSPTPTPVAEQADAPQSDAPQSDAQQSDAQQSDAQETVARESVAPVEQPATPGEQASAPAGEEQGAPVEPAQEAPVAQTPAPEPTTPEAPAPEAPAAEAPAAEAPAAEAPAAEASAAGQQPTGGVQPPAPEPTEPPQSEQAAPAPAPQQAEPSKPAQGDEAAGKGEGARRVSAEERVGSQYRERMEDPEDTGEFFLSSFENPAVKPA